MTFVDAEMWERGRKLEKNRKLEVDASVAAKLCHSSLPTDFHGNLFMIKNKVHHYSTLPNS